MNRLTPNQQQAVTFLPEENKKHLIIEAGAGAGKTKVLCERVKWILTHPQVSHKLSPNQLFLVTFTNDAQKELKERIQNILTESTLQNLFPMLHISTIDSLFDSLVESIFPEWWDKTHGSSKQIPPHLYLIPEKEVQRNLEKNVSHFLKENCTNEKELAMILDFILSGGFKQSSFKLSNAVSTLENILRCMCQDNFLASKQEDIRIVTKQIHPATQNLIMKIHQLARKEYALRLMRGELTYADKTVFLLENLQYNTPVRIKELIVDEYQDTNLLQHKILCQLVNNSHGRLIVVGDPKQSIYGFRGASVSVFQSILNDNQWQHILLNQNFRTEKLLLNEINFLSQLTFNWENPRYHELYKSSFFFEEALKKYTRDNPLLPGKDSLEEETLSPSVSFITTSLASLSEGKINQLSLFAYGFFIKELKDRKNFKWQDIVILCEKNKQVQEISSIFSRIGIPVQTTQPNQDKSAFFYEDYVGLSLLKLLANAADNIDKYLVLTSPLLPYKEEDIIAYFQKKPKVSNSIQEFFETLKLFQEKAQFNFFAAWQEFRWELAYKNSENIDNSILFCEKIDPFAQTLFQQLKNRQARTQLEQSLQNSLSLDFPLPSQIQDYDVVRTQQTQTQNTNGIEIKTIHKAKGLEWPCVCFYPKYSMQMQNGEFIASLSEKTLDISWLNHDIESLSAVKRVDNMHFQELDSIQDEKKKLIRFSELRKQQEENYERQRVFYTAFTRPQKHLVIFQPTLHHSSKKGLFEQAFYSKKTKSFENYLEQSFFVQTIQNKFKDVIPEEKNMDSKNKSVFISEDKRYELVHYPLSAESPNFLQTDSEQNSYKALPKKDNKETQIQNSIFRPWPMEGKEQPVLEPQDQPNAFLLNDVMEEEITTETHNLWNPNILTQKQSQRQKRHLGVVAHAKIENQKAHPHSLLFQFEKRALVIQREIEIWEKRNFSSTRHILDLLMVFETSNIVPFLKTLGNFTELDHWQGKNMENIALIVDLKTGIPKPEDFDQVTRYKELVKPMFSQSQSFMGKNIPIFGALLYLTNPLKEKINLPSNSILLSHQTNRENFYLLTNNS